MLEVQGDGFLIAVQILKIEAVAITAHPVAGPAPRHFDFDRLCSPIHQLAHSGRSRPSPRQVQHLET
jgi:hypothetical protein